MTMRSTRRQRCPTSVMGMMITFLCILLNWYLSSRIGVSLNPPTLTRWLARSSRGIIISFDPDWVLGSKAFASPSGPKSVRNNMGLAIALCAKIFQKLVWITLLGGYHVWASRKTSPLGSLLSQFHSQAWPTLREVSLSCHWHPAILSLMLHLAFELSCMRTSQVPSLAYVPKARS